MLRVARTIAAVTVVLSAAACNSANQDDIAPPPETPAAVPGASSADLYPGGDVSARTPVPGGN